MSDKRVFKAKKNLQFRLGTGVEEVEVKEGSIVPVELPDELANSWIQDEWVEEVKKPTAQQEKKVHPPEPTAAVSPPPPPAEAQKES